MRKSEQPSEILPFLYLGSYYNACNVSMLDRLGITHILNVKDTCKFPEDRFKFRHVPLSDYGDSVLAESVDVCIDFIKSAQESNGRILVHCAVGRNRSPSVVIAFLMRDKNWNLRQAYEYLESRHLFAVHENYFVQLQQLEANLFGTISLSKDDIGPSVQEAIRKIMRERT